MTDDRDLDADLRAWAAATSPEADPITTDEVRSSSAIVTVPRRRVGLVAAVLVAVLGLAAVVVATRDGDAADQVAAGDPSTTLDGTRTQVVVDGDALDGRWWQSVHRIVLRGPCPDAGCASAPIVSARPLEAGTSLAVDEPLAPGRWELDLETYRCGAEDDDCGPPTADGTPSEGGQPDRCTVALSVGQVADRVVVTAGPTANGSGMACPATSGGRLGALTVPPAWSLRPQLPWTCGAATFDINTMMGRPSDPRGALATLGCFRDAVADGTPVEIPTFELGAADGAIRGRWRVLPEPVDGHGVEVLRSDEGSWTRTYCQDVDVEPSDVDTTTPDGGLVGEQHVSAFPSGCGDEEALSLDLPDLDSAFPAPAPTAEAAPDATDAPAPSSDPAPTTVGPTPAPGTVDVVLDIGDLPNATDPITWRWSVHLGDEDVAVVSGRLTGDDADGYTWAQVALVADDLPVPADAEWVGVMVDDGSGTANLCLGGLPPADEPDVRVLVVHIAERACTPEWVAAVPALTVPPTWSLRQPPVTACGDLPATARWGQCLADAAMGGDDVAEWAVGRAGVLTTYRVEGGAVTVVRRVISPDSIDWTSQECRALEAAGDGRAVEPTECDQEVALILEP